MNTNKKRRTRNDGGFTLVELMVVISIIAVLAAIVGYNVLGSVECADQPAERRSDHECEGSATGSLGQPLPVSA
jgi:prepilin-type N-terminal cleavage/methylation domain-containing protein